MGCLFVIILGGVSAGAIALFGYKVWLMVVLGLLWLAALIVSAFGGHRGFGGGPRTDLQIVIAGAFITAAIIVPKYAAQQPCNQPKIALRQIADAENKYFTEHKTFTADINSLILKQNPEVYITIFKADEESFIAIATHDQCSKAKDGIPDGFVWDSAKGGLVQ